jgi:hypothetical protein
MDIIRTRTRKAPKNTGKIPYIYRMSENDLHINDTNMETHPIFRTLP